MPFLFGVDDVLCTMYMYVVHCMACFVCCVMSDEWRIMCYDYAYCLRCHGGDDDDDAVVVQCVAGVYNVRCMMMVATVMAHDYYYNTYVV